MARIVTDEHLVDFQNRAELSIESFGGNVRQIEIDLVLTADTHAINAHLKNRARGNIARNEITVRRILLLEEIQALVFGNRRRCTNVALLARHPNTSAFAAR